MGADARTLARRGPRDRPRSCRPARARAGRSPGGPGSEPRQSAAAKKLFATGLKLYNEGSFREALSAFAKANAIAPRVSLQRNIRNAIAT